MGIKTLIIITNLLIISLVANVVQYNKNRDWREAATPVFKSRGNIDITKKATPRDLANYLNPCLPIDWRERGLAHQAGCNEYGQPTAKYIVRSRFIDLADQELKSFPR